MALNNRSLYGSTTRDAVDGIHALQVRTVEFATNAGAELLPKGNPVKKVGTTWRPLKIDGGGEDTQIDGFVVEQGGVQTSATEEVLGVVMLKGEINLGDIGGFSDDGGALDVTDAEFLIAARSNGTRQNDLTITGLSGVG